MKIIEAPQGSAEWLAIRAQHFTASEAPAMLGLSKYKTRQALLREKATGLTEEIDAAKQQLFDRGHESEAAARPLAEAFLQEDLFPATGAAEIDGLPLLASFDGLNMEETLVWENKLESAGVLGMIAQGVLDGTYWPQVEQQLLVSGAERALFTACDGKQITAQLWYESQPERRAALIAGWKQFAEDLANYQHVEAAPVAVAAPQMALPALSIQINGSISLIDNLNLFGSKLTDFITGLPAKPATDQEFADAEAAVKTLKAAEEALDAAESSALAQTASIDQMRRTVGLYRDQARTARLMLDKLVKARKESIRIEIVTASSKALSDHLAGLSKRIGMQMPACHGDFHGAIKGKKLLSALRDACDSELARGKIEANEIADLIQINIGSLDETGDYAFLFADRAVLCLKAPGDLALVIKTRISDHKAAEAKREEETRARIRAEEEARAAAKVKAEQEEAERQRLDDAAIRTIETLGSGTEPAPPPATVAPTTDSMVGYTAASQVAVAGLPERVRLLERLSDLTIKMTARELSDLCIYAAHLLENRKEAA